MDAVKRSVITDGFCLINQAEAGALKQNPTDKARRYLLTKAKAVEEAYLAGEIGAKEVLLQAANHFSHEQVAKYLQNVTNIEEDVEPIERQDSNDSNPPQLPDLDELDEREAVLAQDPDLTDVEERPWITSVWPSCVSGNIHRIN